MKFSKRSTYGLRAMARLAKYLDTEFVSLAEISRQEGISKKYLEQIFIKLKMADLVKTGRGKQGGYKLFSKSEKISVAEIIEALEGKISPARCLTGEGVFDCEKGKDCGVALLLVEVQNKVKEVLSETSLRDIEKYHK